MSVEHTSIGLMVFDGPACARYNRGHIGIDMFHSHLNALAVARGTNRKAGEKVVRVVFRKEHFMVLPVDRSKTAR